MSVQDEVAVQGAVKVPAPGVYDIDVSHSTVQGIARHLMVSKVRVSLSEFSGGIRVADEPGDSQVSVVFAAASVDSRDAKRDEHLRSADFLDVEQFPDITFSSTGVAALRDGWSVDGLLTIKGVTRPVTLDMTYLGTFANPFGQTIAAFSAATAINREDFGMTWNAALESGGVLVSKDVAVEIEIQAALRPDA